METKDKNYQNILLVAMGLVLFLFGGNYLMQPLDLHPEQYTFLSGMVWVAVIIFGIVMAIRINSKKEDNG